MIVYKLTDIDGYTRPGMYNEVHWHEGRTLKTSGDGYLCGPGWIHAYDHPLLAILHRHLHVSYHEVRLWECDATGDILKHMEIKLGTTCLTVIREIQFPKVPAHFHGIYSILLTRKATGLLSFGGNFIQGGEIPSPPFGPLERQCVDILKMCRLIPCDAINMVNDHVACAKKAYCLSLNRELILKGAKNGLE